MARKLRRAEYSNVIVPPIQAGISFSYDDHACVTDAREGRIRAGRYGRYHNSTWESCESDLAALEAGEAALLFPSGMSAVFNVFLTFLKRGDAIVYTRCGYRNIDNLIQSYVAEWGVDARPINQSASDPFLDQLERTWDASCRMIFVEMPSNPHLFLVDLALVREIVGPEAIVVVDSTMATPVNFKPLSFGADIVVHSCTKYMNGYADCMAGAIVSTRGNVERARQCRDISGAVPSAGVAASVSRGLSSLAMRMRHANEVGLGVARHLERHPRVGGVFYTGLSSHPHASLASTYLKGHGSVVTFEVRGGHDAARRFVEETKVPYIGSHFGSHVTMIEHLPFFTYHKLDELDRDDIGITDGLVRLSIGHESVDEIILDLDNALGA